MNKNDLINEVISSLVFTLEKDLLDLVKSTFIIKMQGYEIHQVCTLPSAEVKDNEYILKRFSIDMLAKGVKQSSIKAYNNLIIPFLEYTHLNYRAVKAQDIIDYLAIKKVTPNKTGRKNSQTYISNINRVLFIFFEWAYRKHHIDEDIMRDVDRIRPKQKRKERISPEEMEACRDSVSDIKRRALLELMLSTGLRVSEIANLRIEEIDLLHRRVHISAGKSEYAIRTVYLTIKAKNALMRLIGTRQCGYVFRPDRKVLADDKPISTGSIEKMAKEIGTAGNCHCVTTVHVFRKTYASEEYKRTKNIKHVSILLGHSSSAVTEKYYLVDDLKEIEYQALYAA